MAIFTIKTEKFSNSELVWFNSLLNEYDSDKLYFKARDFAFNKEYDKALLLARYILSESPSHIDTKILTGRVNAWIGNRKKSIKILNACTKMNPNYIDSYAALFDVYYWDDRHKEALELISTVKQNSSSANEIADKIARAQQEARKNRIVASN